MYKILLFFTVTFLLTACNSKFDEYLQNGKDAMLIEDYELAVKELNAAVIEKPSNEDAKLLLEKAESKLQEIELAEEKALEQIKREEIFKDYAANISDIYFYFFDEHETIESANTDQHINLINESLANITSQPPKVFFNNIKFLLTSLKLEENQHKNLLKVKNMLKTKF